MAECDCGRESVFVTALTAVLCDFVCVCFYVRVNPPVRRGGSLTTPLGLLPRAGKIVGSARGAVSS